MDEDVEPEPSVWPLRFSQGETSAGFTIAISSIGDISFAGWIYDLLGSCSLDFC